MDPLSGGLDGLNTTLNSTALNSTMVSSQTALSLLLNVDNLLLEVQLIGGAMGIIYLAAHASLRRPPSAAAAKSKRGPGRKPDNNTFLGDDDTFSQGMGLADAIFFPVMAAVVLVSLYYLIQWLKDPTLLNKILRYYMSTASIVSLLTLYTHGLECLASLILPSYWRGRDGLLRKVNQETRTVAICDHVGNRIKGHGATSNPLPGLLALFAPSERLQRTAWHLRDLQTRHWVLKASIPGICDETVRVKFVHMMALFLSMATALVYFSTSWLFMSNMLGYGMCYGTLLLISPTNFLIGSLVLCGLFFYDIFMVFYTPYMVTVATTLDVPIKLTFQAAGNKSILGLGDIILPGILICWSLRLDLWMHYSRKIKYESIDLMIVEEDAATGAPVTRSEAKHREVKAPYLNAKGSWGERMWTRGTLFLSGPRHLPSELEATKFPKTYFYVSMAGYFLGMLFTMAMLMVFKRGQPALLYLVPGTLGSLLLTSLARGEFKELRTYTEDGSLDKMDVVVELDGNGKAIEMDGKFKFDNGKEDTSEDEEEEKEDDDKDKGEPEKDDGKSRRVFLLSLEAE